MKTRDRFAIFGALNICLLIGGAFLGVVEARRIPPHWTKPRHAFHEQVEKITSDEKVGQLLIDDDAYIRALENLTRLYHKVLTSVCFVASGAALGSLLLFPWKPQKLNSPPNEPHAADPR